MISENELIGNHHDECARIEEKSLKLPQLLAELTSLKEKANSAAAACAAFHCYEKARREKPLPVCRPRCDKCPAIYCRVYRRACVLPCVSTKLLCIDDYESLRDGNIVNETIMNSFIGLLNNRNMNHPGHSRPSAASEKQYETAAEDFMPHAYICDTHFFPTLTDNDCTRIEAQKQNLLPLRNVPDIDILVIPIELCGNHWVLAAFDLMKKHLVYYNPQFKDESLQARQGTNRWLQDEFREVCRTTNSRPDVENWTFICNPDWSPRQEDNTSSAVFVLCVAQMLASGEEPNFCQEDIPRLRKNIANALLMGSL